VYKGGEGLAREISSCSVGTVGMEACQKFNMGRVANSYPVISVTTRHFIKFLVFLSMIIVWLAIFSMLRFGFDFLHLVVNA